MSIPTGKTTLPEQLPIFNERFYSFSCKKEHPTILSHLFQTFVPYPSLYLWERVGLGINYNISHTRAHLPEDAKESFEQIAQKIRELFHQTIAMQFPLTDSKKITFTEWEEYKSIIPELEALIPSFQDDHIVYVGTIVILLELFFNYTKEFENEIQNDPSKRNTFIDPSKLLITQKIINITRNFLPNTGKKSAFTFATQSTLGFHNWILGSRSRFFPLISREKIILLFKNPIDKLISHIADVSKMLYSEGSNSNSDASLPFDEQAFFLHIFREFCIAAGILFSEDPWGKDIQKKMFQKITGLLGTERIVDENYDQVIEKRIEQSEETDLAKSFVRKSRELDRSANQSLQKLFRSLLGLYYSEIQRLQKVRMGQYLSLSFLFVIELLKPREIDGEEPKTLYQLILEGQAQYAEIMQKFRAEFHKKWKEKLSKLSKRKDREKAEKSARTRAKEIQDIYNNKESFLYVYSTAEKKIELGEILLGLIVPLMSDDENHLLMQGWNKIFETINYFSGLEERTEKTIAEWKPMRSISQQLVKKPRAIVKSKRSVSEKLTQKRIVKAKKADDNQEKPTRKEPQNPKIQPKSLHEQALKAIEQQKQKQIEEEKNTPEESKAEVESKSPTAPATQREQVKKDADPDLHFPVSNKLDELVKFIQSQGFTHHRTRSSHNIFVHPSGKSLSVPGKLGKSKKGQTVAKGTATTIWKEAQEIAARSKQKSKK